MPCWWGIQPSKILSVRLLPPKPKKPIEPIMGEFFKPWRRKLGLVTLLLACVLAVGWIRSFFRYEFIEAPLGNSAIGVASMHGGIDFYRIVSLNDKPILTSIQCLSTAFRLDPHEPPNTTPWGSEFVFDWRWDWAGFHVGEGQYSHRRDQDCMIPYWAVILPLTAISGRLLLKSPRAALTCVAKREPD